MKGIIRSRAGFRSFVQVGEHQRFKRWPADTKTSTMQNWCDETRVALRKLVRKPTRDTLRADAVRYLEHQKTKLATSTYRSRVCEIEAWYPAFGDLPRHTLTRTMVLDERQRWRAEPRGGKGRDADQPIAPKTCNHRVRALRHLYHYLDGSRAETPCDDIPKLKEPDANPQFVTPATIRRVASKLEDPQTRARFMVLTATGQRPAQLKRAVPGDINIRRGLWIVRPAKGGQTIPVILTDDMKAAWRAFLDADAFGDFDGSDYAKQLYAAGWPKWIRPYNAKHTVAITLGNSDAEWEDIKDWFGHRDVKSTRIYTGQILSRYKRTSARLAGRIGWK